MRGTQVAVDLGLLDAQALRRQSRQVRRRRESLRGLGATTTVSALVATNRPEFVGHAVRTVAKQRNVAVETILVTHGFELPGRTVRALRRIGLAVTVREAPADLPLGAVLNIALEAASGDVVSKLDDDDWYGPHHLEDLLHLLETSGAMLVGAVDEFSYLAELDLTVRHRRPEKRNYRARTVGGPSMTMRRDDLHALGGWQPLPRHVDQALNRAVQQAGGVARRAHGLGYLRCRHNLGHTWVRPAHRFADNAAGFLPGFHPPPELPMSEHDLAHYLSVRAASR